MYEFRTACCQQIYRSLIQCLVLSVIRVPDEQGQIAVGLANEDPVEYNN